jgi:hypothetical protein
MAPEVQALAQSESKAKFMLRLGLNERNPDHKHLYHMMKVSIPLRVIFSHYRSNSLTNLQEEASAGRYRILLSPNNLRNDSVQNAQPPYSNSQVNETAVHREILNIYQRARPETKYFYDKGRDTQGPEEENWVIRWLLWHVFRYRDNRNKNRRQGSPDRGSPSSSENSSSEGPPHGGNGTFAVFKLHRQAAKIVRRQQWTLEWSFECKLEWGVVQQILRPDSRHLTVGLKLRFRDLFVEPFAGCTSFWCLAEN